MHAPLPNMVSDNLQNQPIYAMNKDCIMIYISD